MCISMWRNRVLVTKVALSRLVRRTGMLSCTLKILYPTANIFLQPLLLRETRLLNNCYLEILGTFVFSAKLGSTEI